MRDTTAATITGRRRVLIIGMWSALLYVALSVAYLAAVVASGAAYGKPKDPYWAIAEVIVVVGSPILVILVATIHDSASRPARMFTLLAFGWTLIMAALTITVHAVELTVTRRIDGQAIPGVSHLFGFEWPSLLMAIGLLAWHLFFGLALLFAAFGFRCGGKEAVVRIGLIVSGGLCLVGLLGPALGSPMWRLPGVLGYGVIFPLVCIMIGVVFKKAAASLDQDQYAAARVPRTPALRPLSTSRDIMKRARTLRLDSGACETASFLIKWMVGGLPRRHTAEHIEHRYASADGDQARGD
jgi:hypothetical protein